MNNKELQILVLHLEKKFRNSALIIHKDFLLQILKTLIKGPNLHLNAFKILVRMKLTLLILMDRLMKNLLLNFSKISFQLI